jgi:hypothetical protein
VYVKLSTVVPAGTVGGSVNITRKFAVAEVWLGVKKDAGLANRTTAIITIATSTAAKPYFKVHLSDILLYLCSVVDLEK